MAAPQHRVEVLDDLAEACDARDWQRMRALLGTAQSCGTHNQWRLRIDALRRAIGDAQHHGAPVDRVAQALTSLRLHNY